MSATRQIDPQEPPGVDPERINPDMKVTRTDILVPDRNASMGDVVSVQMDMTSSMTDSITGEMGPSGGNGPGDVNYGQHGREFNINNPNQTGLDSTMENNEGDLWTPEGIDPGHVHDYHTFICSQSQTVMDVISNKSKTVMESHMRKQTVAPFSYKENCVDAEADDEDNEDDDDDASNKEESEAKSRPTREIMFLEGFEDNEPRVVSMTIEESNSGIGIIKEKIQQDQNSSKVLSDLESDSGSEISDGEWQRLNQAFSARQFQESSDLSGTSEFDQNLSRLEQNLSFGDQNVFDSLTRDGVGLCSSDDVILVGTEIGSLRGGPASRYFPSKRSKHFAEQSSSMERTPSHADVEQQLLTSWVSSEKTFLQKKNPKKNTMAKIFNWSRITSVNPAPLDSLKCSVCATTFAEEKSLQEHMDRHKGTKTNYLKCSQCPRVFSTKYTLAMHERIHSDFRPFHCNICGKGFYQRANIKVHMRAHTGERPFKCDICGKAYTVKLSLAAHSGTHVKENKFACKKCKFCFSNEEDLEKHQQVHAIQRTHECPKCKKKFLKAYLLEFHLQRDCAEKRFVCEYCDKAFTHLDYLKVHQRVHTGEKPFGCEVCGKFFSQSANLTKHLKIHNNIRDFACDMCDATFIEKASMISHRRTHTGEKPHMCDICGMAFSSPSSLVIHIRVHTGEKPYVCDMCDKRFNSSGKLRDHKRTHTGEKPYKCKYCDRRFALSNGLVRHTRIHTGERPHKCDVCGMRFIRKDRMRKHRSAHGTRRRGFYRLKKLCRMNWFPKALFSLCNLVTTCSSQYQCREHSSCNNFPL